MSDKTIKFNITELDLIFDDLNSNDFDIIKNRLVFNILGDIKYPLKSFNLSLNTTFFQNKSASFCVFVEISEKYKMPEKIEEFNPYKLDNDVFEVKNENEHVCYIKNQNNFGIYIFNGRPDLYSKMDKNNFLNYESIYIFEKGFLNTLKVVKSLVKEVYEQNNICLEDDILIDITSAYKKLSLNRSEQQKNEIPQALKRFYKKIRYSYE